MKKTPLISIITVVKDDAQGFLITARSILNQNYTNIEWIVVDGLSRDTTGHYIRQLTPQISEYKIEVDNGIYNAMNKGIDMATGDWIIFMNADDAFYSKETVFLYVNNMKEDDEILFADVIRREDKEIQQYPDQEEFWRGMIFDHQTACVKSSIYKIYKYDESYKLSGDLNFFLNARINGHKFRKIPGLKACIKPFDGGKSSSYYHRQKERVAVLKKYFNGEKLKEHLCTEYHNMLKSKKLNNEQYNTLICYVNE